MLVVFILRVIKLSVECHFTYRCILSLIMLGVAILKFVMLSVECHYTERSILSVVMIGVFILRVIKLNLECIKLSDVFRVSLCWVFLFLMSLCLMNSVIILSD
jgi:hypothetical protein